MANTHRASHSARSKTDRGGDGLPRLLRSAAEGVGISLLAGALGLLLCTLICLRLTDPAAPISAMGTALGFSVFFLSGLIAVRKNRGSVLLSGLCSGGLLSLLLWPLRLLLSGESSLSSGAAWLLRILAVLFALFGAYLGHIRIGWAKKPRSHGHKHQSRR